MTEQNPHDPAPSAPSRRAFLKCLGGGAVTGAVAILEEAGTASGAPAPPAGHVGQRVLGKTGLKISEIGFGGHSWSIPGVPAAGGSFRKVTVDEAMEMIRMGLEMGVNFLDSCTPLEESSTPGEALKRLKARDRVVISIRVSHKMKGRKEDRNEIFKWTNIRLKLWQTECVDLCLLCNTARDTPQSGYWDMSYAIEALDKLKQQGKIRYTGFGCHFTPELFLQAIDRFGDYFDVCSLPYNIRHRAAERVFAAAKKRNLGTITIKPFARGALLTGRGLGIADATCGLAGSSPAAGLRMNPDLDNARAGLARDMISFVLENQQVDICTCGVHALGQVREDFSAAWTKLTPEGRQRLGLAAATPCPGHGWLEEGWRVV
jgi:aryl-alcohol dehydrogenase-like predicted oxidoreductase